MSVWGGGYGKGTRKGGRIDNFLLAVIPRRGHGNHSMAVSKFKGGGHLVGIGCETEAHINHPGSVLDREVDRAQDIRQITGTVHIESLQMHDLRGRSHEVNDARHHGPMTECLVLWLLIEVERRCWVENRSARLVHHRW